MLGEGATAADVSALRHAYGLDAAAACAVWAYYWRGCCMADLGQSLRLHDSVTHLVLQRYPYTLALTLAALLLGIAAGGSGGGVVGAASGSVAGPDAGRGVAGGAVVSELCAGADSDSGVFDRAGVAAGVGCGDGAGGFVAAPGAAGGDAGAGLAAILTRMVRTAMLEELGQDYIRTARAKGLTERAGGVSARAAECADPGADGGGAAVWEPAGGGDCDGDDLQSGRGLGG